MKTRWSYHFEIIYYFNYELYFYVIINVCVQKMSLHIESVGMCTDCVPFLFFSIFRISSKYVLLFSRLIGTSRSRIDMQTLRAARSYRVERVVAMHHSATISSDVFLLTLIFYLSVLHCVHLYSLYLQEFYSVCFSYSRWLRQRPRLSRFPRMLYHQRIFFRAYIFWTLSDARSQLYRSQSLQKKSFESS